MSDHYDVIVIVIVIVIGSGAGGGTVAHTLAPTGKRILMLERGGFLPREPQNWDPRTRSAAADAARASHRTRAHWYTTKTEPSYDDMTIKLRRVSIAARFHGPSDPAGRLRGRRLGVG